MKRKLEENLSTIGNYLDKNENEKALKLLNATFSKYMSHLFTKDNVQFLETYRKILATIEKGKNQQEIEKAYHSIGLLYFWRGQHTQAIEYFQDIINLLPENALQRKAKLLNTIGVTYAAKGELNNAKEQYQKSLTLSEEIKNIEMIAVTLGNLGDIFTLKGELNLAIDYHEKSSAKLEELKDKTSKTYRGAKAYSLLNMGKIHAQKGNLDQALEYYEKSLILYDGFETHPAEVLFQMIRLFLDRYDFDRANVHMKQLQTIAAQYDKNHHTNLYARLAYALTLKYSARDRNKFKALEIFQEVAEEEFFIHELMIFALLNYCDLILFELQTFGNEEIIREAREITTRLIKIAEKQHSYWLLSEVYLLQSKLALLELDIPRAQNMLQKSYNIAKERDLTKLTEIISQEQQALMIQVQQWEKSTQLKTPVKERIELSQLEELLDRMIHKRLYTKREELKEYMVMARQLTDEWDAEE